MKRKGITAKELMQRLEADPEWTVRRADRDQRHQERARKLAEDQASLIDELAQAGVRVQSVYDFVNHPSAGPEAIRVLVRHLGVPHLPSVREGIIRALTIPSARSQALHPLIEHFVNESEPALKWVIANGLSAMATLEELAGIQGIEEFSDLFPGEHRS
jgi:hypothetical protein